MAYAFNPSPEPRWSTLAASGTPPAQRYLASIVYDPVRDRLLVIGSYQGQAIDVWALTLSGAPAWQRLATSGDPPGRYGHSTIYDPLHDRLLMYGGMSQSSPTRYLSEVWTLSLSSGAWTTVALSGAAPGGREGHGTLYDPERRRMIVFGGHYEDGARRFWNDLWELSLGDTIAWSEISASGPAPGARSAFGLVYDPVRRRMLVHGGVNAQSGTEPDDLWALSLEGTPAWTEIVTKNTLRGRSYPVDVYDPVEDRLLACGGSGYPQASELPLSAPVRWNAVLPPLPLLTPGARSGHAVLHDARRDRFLVVGGGYSTADSAMWSFRPEGASHWQSLRTPIAPRTSFNSEYSRATVYDSLGDRTILFDGGRVWGAPAARPQEWVQLGPPAPTEPVGLGSGAALALDSRRNRLLVTGGWNPYPHSAGYTVGGVWSLSLGPDPSWSFIGALPQPHGSAGHASYYDPVRDRLVILGGYEIYDRPTSRRSFGAIVWSTQVDSVLQWTQPGPVGAALPAPPEAHACFDPRNARLYIASDSTIWTREVDDTGPWTEVVFSTPRPTISSTVAYDTIRDQLLALFASSPESGRVDAWAAAVGPLSVSLLEANRSFDAVALRWRSVTAYGRAATIERREESGDWMELSPLVFDTDGLAAFTDHDIHLGHNYLYRVGVSDGSSMWHSDPILVADPAWLRLTLLGARPNPAIGSIQLAFSLPGIGSARLEVFDIHGRRCSSGDVGALGPGMHVMGLKVSSIWRPGVYYARLERGGETRTARFVLLR